MPSGRLRGSSCTNVWVANWLLRRCGQLIESTTVRLPAIRANVSALPFAVVAHLGGRSATEGAVNSAFVVYHSHFSFRFKAVV